MPLYQPLPQLGRWLNTTAGGVVGTSQTFVVGRVLLAQFVAPQACQVDGVTYTVGSTSAGSVIVGILGPVSRTSDSADAAPVVVQSASTAQAAVNALQLITWTAITLRPGIYYAALEGSDATGTYMRQPNVIQATALYAQYDRAGGYGALTDPTPTTAATNILAPGFRIRLA